MQAIVTTKHRGVFYGSVSDTAKPGKKPVKVASCVMAITWGTTGGLFQLADTGPTSDSKISAMSPEVTLSGVTSIVLVTKESEAAWKPFLKD